MSKTIPRPFIDDLLNRCDIVALVESFVPLKKQGQNYVACCPFHNEKTPSFSVSPTKQIYHCFGCGVGGNAIGFLMEYDHMHFVEAVEELATRQGVEVPKEFTPGEQTYNENDYEVLQQVAHFYQQQLREHPQAKFAVEYLKKRGLTGEIAKHFGIGFSPPGWDCLSSHFANQKDVMKSLLDTGMVIQKDKPKPYDRFRHRIMFPIRDRRGRTIGFGGRVLSNEDHPKYLNSADSPVFHKGRELYGLYEALQTNRRLKSILIVEGYMDVIALAQHGVTNSVATLGTATTAEHIQILLRTCSRLIFCFDGDTAGKQAAWRALETAIPQLRQNSDISFLFLPEGEDPDSIIRLEGKEAFRKRAINATGLGEYMLEKLQQEYNCKTLSGKSQLLQAAASLLSKMPNITLRQMIQDEIAKILHMPNHRIAKMLRLPQKTKSDDENRETSNINLSANLKLALALLLQNPTLSQLVQDDLPIDNSNGWLIWQQTLHYIRSHKEALTAAGLLEFWRDDENSLLINQLIQWQHLVPQEDVESEFKTILSNFKQISDNQIVDDLMRIAKQRELSLEERTTLQRLIQNRHSETQSD
jgi:DNA primase